MTEEKQEPREFWATQDPREADGIYIMSEDEPLIIDHEVVEVKFKVIEKSAFDTKVKECEELRTEIEVLKEELIYGANCSVCGGSGEVTENADDPIKECEKCKGLGMVSLQGQIVELRACLKEVVGASEAIRKNNPDLTTGSQWAAKVDCYEQAIEKANKILEGKSQ